MTQQNLRQRTVSWRRVLACLWLWLNWLIVTPPGVLAEEVPPQPASKPSPSIRRNDPLSLVEGSADSWSVLNSETGCYLMSAYRKGSSRLAIGRHPVLGLGLFATGFGLSVPSADATEAVAIQTGHGSFIRQGRIAANMLLFVALDPSAVQASLGELEEFGVLWIVVRKAAVAHGGKEIGAAITEYKSKCDGHAHSP